MFAQILLRFDRVPDEGFSVQFEVNVHAVNSNKCIYFVNTLLIPWHRGKQLAAIQQPWGGAGGQGGPAHRRNCLHSPLWLQLLVPTSN
jgi:hypothetical protein